MRSLRPLLLALTLWACPTPDAPAQPSAASPRAYLGFDRNEYPGDEKLATLRRHFAFTGFWLNPPPGSDTNTWAGTREHLLQAGFGFLVLWNGRIDAEILKSRNAGTSPADLGRQDASAAVAAARHENFPPGTVLFLDQEEGGRLLKEQADYLLSWTGYVAASGFRAGVYASGQPAPDGPGQTITTVRNIQDLQTPPHHPAPLTPPITLWVAQDACPPSNGCSLHPPPIAESGTPEASVWQYAQSPRRPALTQACASTYAADGNCYAPELPGLHLDLDLALTPDPSHGR